MPRALQRTIQFDIKAGRPKHAIVMIYDIAGFSKFFNQPDAQEYVPRFSNRISEAISVAIFGGKEFWEKEGAEELIPLLSPVHEKFLGDGALYIWLPPHNETDFSSGFVAYLCNRLWNIQNNFDTLRKKCSEDIPVFDLPQGIRFGLARGTVYELINSKTRAREYIGVCINLASRLQKYCSDLAFMASARMRISDQTLKKFGYIKVVATKLKGFPKEIVIVDKSEYNELAPEIRQGLFESI